MKKIKADNISEYIDAFPKEIQKKLKEVRATIRKAAPKAEEKISYGIPAFTHDGKNLIYFAGYAKHVGLYPAPRNVAEFKKALSEFEGGKGTVQFPHDQPLPLALIKKIVKYRIKEIAVKTKEKALKNKA